MGDQRGLHGDPGAPARGGRPGKGGCPPAVEALAVAGEAIGRSRGGLSSKVHLAVDGRGLPMRVILTPGQDGDNPQLLPLLGGIRSPGPVPAVPGPGPDGAGGQGILPPVHSPCAAGTADTSRQPRALDQNARRRGAGSRGGRPPAFDAQLYKQRNVVERCFSRLKQFRDLATRYAKRAAYYQAELTIAAIILWLR